ncbi:jg17026 [Pararge aegeria aegeria]|uniref:Jg17026 protein n=1 Tax=Pararge aegeria aegeria TaxID=348720 RepID=A0A8S4R0Q5_9NEOP|nr:jg17026 [Pararge aegeria aegeria]
MLHSSIDFIGENIVPRKSSKTPLMCIRPPQALPETRGVGSATLIYSATRIALCGASREHASKPECRYPPSPIREPDKTVHIPPICMCRKVIKPKINP